MPEYEPRMAADKHMHDSAYAMEQLQKRVQRAWARALVQALTEPMDHGEQPDMRRPSAPIEQLAAYAAGEAWPVVERIVRPIFVSLAGPGPPSEKLLTERAPSLPPARPAVWLSTDEVAPVVGITAHTAPTPRKSRKESDCRPSHGGPLVVLPDGRRTSPQDRQRPSRRYLHVNRSIRPEGMWSARSPVARSTMAFARWFRSVGILVRLATWLGYGRDPVARRDRVPRVRREGPDPAWTINDRRRTLGPLLDPLGRRGGASVRRRDLLAA